MLSAALGLAEDEGVTGEGEGEGVSGSSHWWCRELLLCLIGKAPFLQDVSEIRHVPLPGSGKLLERLAHYETVTTRSTWFNRKNRQRKQKSSHSGLKNLCYKTLR